MRIDTQRNVEVLILTSITYYFCIINNGIRSCMWDHPVCKWRVVNCLTQLTHVYNKQVDTRIRVNWLSLSPSILSVLKKKYNFLCIVKCLKIRVRLYLAFNIRVECAGVNCRLSGISFDYFQVHYKECSLIWGHSVKRLNRWWSVSF